MGPLATRALVHASANVGQQENPIGSNWGFPVSKWIETAGGDSPEAWCAAFVYSMFDEAAHDLGIANPLPKTAGCLDMWAKAKANQVHIPQAGDFFIMDYGNGEGHAGLIEAIDGDPGSPTDIHTIEGNSAPPRSSEAERREGYCVCRHIQDIPNKLIIGYLRF